ncbi:Gp49 family protein [Heyndrickxia acidicola]|uniref:Gp49 family protein n=1 Tax=Heyndrickxia acidicola TaxID=209389 RepID=A0ABU6MAX3_9BACI|nr:Gp49 family protein [Heyndrickxia acidicola]MED1201781.1 Gp49 family protein [Heyndrickxia acidicola]
MVFIDSICPKCEEISHVEHHGEESLIITCKNNHIYKHLVTPTSRQHEITNEKRQKLEEMIVEKKFHRMSDKSTICLLIFDNGYEIEGRSTVRDIEDFRLVIGKDKAYDQALRKAMVALGGYLS